MRNALVAALQSQERAKHIKKMNHMQSLQGYPSMVPDFMDFLRVVWTAFAINGVQATRRTNKPRTILGSALNEVRFFSMIKITPSKDAVHKSNEINTETQPVPFSLFQDPLNIPPQQMRVSAENSPSLTPPLTAWSTRLFLHSAPKNETLLNPHML